MISAHGYAALDKKGVLVPYSFQRRDPGPKDVVIDILYCGICHSDLHQARNEWSSSTYPMVPGHEIVGKVRKVGKQVKHFKEGDFAGVGCMVNSCRTCASCHESSEQFCETGASFTYNSYDKQHNEATFGGYSDCIVVDEDFTLRISKQLELSQTAPLLCAGITTYSPLKHWGVKKGHKVGVMGLGGLGHMGVKLANAMGAHTVVFTQSEKKAEDAIRLGAKDVIVSKTPDAFKKHFHSFNLILNTVSANVDLVPYLETLRRDGTLVFLGVPEHPFQFNPSSLIFKRRNLSGSLIGGIRETQEMLDFCAENGIGSDIELISASQINEAYERLLKGDVRYRFVIDMQSLKKDIL